MELPLERFALSDIYEATGGPSCPGTRDPGRPWRRRTSGTEMWVRRQVGPRLWELEPLA